MNTQDLLQNYMNTAVAIMDDLDSRSTDSNDEVRIAIEQHREAHGTVEFRQAITNFAINTETFLESFSDDEREYLFNTYEWDFEWLPTLMNTLHENGVKWWAADLAQISVANQQLMNKKVKYAQQTLFTYGWDYVGSIDGKRQLFDTREEAQSDLNDVMPDLKLLGYSVSEWRVVQYNEADDDKSDLD